MRTTLQDAAIGTAAQFPVWKTIKLGTGPRVAREFRILIGAAGMLVGDCANEILDKPPFKAAREEHEIDLAVVSVADLTFRDGAPFRDIIAKAIKMGLALCPAEVGPQLRLQYADQRCDEWLAIAMGPIADSIGYPHVFGVGDAHGNRWLRAYDGHPDSFWDADCRFVFLRPRQ